MVNIERYAMVNYSVFSILIEECWKALARQGMSEYIQYLFKTVRKFFGEAIVVTQEVEDIISSPIVKQAIVNNSDCKILLDQSKFQNKFDEIQNLLGLTEKDKSLILSINKANDPGRKYKEVFISLGNSHSKVYRTEVSPEEYFTYTTEESEKVRVQEYATRFGSFHKGVAALVAALRMEGKLGSSIGIMTLCCTLFFAGCKNPPPEDPIFLPGVYVSQVENDFCKIIDTLVIRKNELGNSGGYQVIRKSSFRRIKDGKEMTAEMQGDEWRAGYSAQEECLVPANKGDKIRYVTDSNKIYKRDFVYEKIE